MSAPTSTAPVFDPSVPMTARWRSDIAWRIAQGWTWKELSETLKCNLDELRLVVESDPEFEAVQEKAWARVTFEGETDAMRQLRLIANTGSDTSAKDACAVLARYAAQRRDNQTRLEIEKLRAQTRLEVERLRNERAPARERARQAREEEAPAARPAGPAEGEREEGHAEEASRRGEEVYIWGGGHGVGCGFRPDAADLRVRVLKDRSRAGGSVYWVVAPEEGDEVQTALPKAAPSPTTGLSA